MKFDKTAHGTTGPLQKTFSPKAAMARIDVLSIPLRANSSRALLRMRSRVSDAPGGRPGRLRSVLVLKALRGPSSERCGCEAQGDDRKTDHHDDVPQRDCGQVGVCANLLQRL